MNRFLSYEQFLEQLMDQLSHKIRPGQKLRMGKVTKPNMREADTIVIDEERDEAHASPTFVALEMFEIYLNGSEPEEVADTMLAACERAARERTADGYCQRDFANVKDRICYRLVNRDLNQEYLQSVPHLDYLDLAIIFCVVVDPGDRTIASFTIDRPLMEEWGQTEETLMELARTNTRQVLGCWSSPLSEEIAKNWDDEAAQDGPMYDPDSGVNVYVVTTRYKCHGAFYMLEKDLLRKFATEAGQDILIIPSSIHEILLCPANEARREYIDDVIRSVNQSVVHKKEYLSDHSYLYSLQADDVTA